nr:DUF645 family protein [Vibrio cholerae]
MLLDAPHGKLGFTKGCIIAESGLCCVIVNSRSTAA